MNHAYDVSRKQISVVLGRPWEAMHEGMVEDGRDDWGARRMEWGGVGWKEYNHRAGRQTCACQCGLTDNYLARVLSWVDNMGAFASINGFCSVLYTSGSGGWGCVG
jgi:hypothetical protein